MEKLGPETHESLMLKLDKLLKREVLKRFWADFCACFEQSRNLVLA